MEFSANVKNLAKIFFRDLILIAFIVFILFLGSQTVGLSQQGFDFSSSVINTALTQFFFYTGPAAGYLIGILVISIALLILSLVKDNPYGTSIAFNSPGEEPAIPGKFFKSPAKLGLVCLGIFTIFGLYAAINHQTYIGVGTLQHQFSFVSNLLYSSLLVPPAENLGAAFFYAFGVLIFIICALIWKWQKATYNTITIIYAVLSFGVFGWLNHLARYGGSDIAVFSVIVFWAVGGLLTVSSGSFIPFWILHLINNLFFSLGSKFSNDAIMYGVIAFEIILIAGFLFFYFGRKPKPSPIYGEIKTP